MSRRLTFVQLLTLVPVALFAASFFLPAFRYHVELGAAGLNDAELGPYMFTGLEAAYFSFVAIPKLGYLGDSEDVLEVLLLLSIPVSVSTNLWFVLGLLFMFLKKWKLAVIFSAVATLASLAILPLGWLKDWLVGYWVWVGSCMALLAVAILGMFIANRVKELTAKIESDSRLFKCTE